MEFCSEKIRDSDEEIGERRDRCNGTDRWMRVHQWINAEVSLDIKAWWSLPPGRSGSHHLERPIRCKLAAFCAELGRGEMP